MCFCSLSVALSLMPRFSFSRILFQCFYSVCFSGPVGPPIPGGSAGASSTRGYYPSIYDQTLMGPLKNLCFETGYNREIPWGCAGIQWSLHSSEWGTEGISWKMEGTGWWLLQVNIKEWKFSLWWPVRPDGRWNWVPSSTKIRLNRTFETQKTSKN